MEMVANDPITEGTICAWCGKPFELADVITLSHGRDGHRLIIRADMRDVELESERERLRNVWTPAEG
jgi:hypothetical protein